MVAKYPDTASRLAHVMAICGYSTDVSFADAIGLRPQNLRNWRERDRIGRDSLERIRTATGASMDWMSTGKGEPFPDGPIRYAGAAPSDVGLADRLARAEAAVDALAGVVAALLRATRGRMPAVVAEVADGIRRAADREDAPGFLPHMLAAVDSPRAAPAGSGAPQPRKRK